MTPCPEMEVFVGGGHTGPKSVMYVCMALKFDWFDN